MQIECTNNMIKRLMEINSNMRRSVRVRSLEAAIDNGRMVNLMPPICANLYSAIKDYALKQNKELTEDDFNACAAMPIVIEPVDIIDEYVKKMASLCVTEGKYSFHPVFFHKNSLLVIGEPELDDDFIGKSLHFGIFGENQIGYVMEENTENGTIINSGVNYSEYKTKERLAEKAEGNVCVYGDSCLFFTFMLSKNPNVDKIIVICDDEEGARVRRQILDRLKLEKVILCHYHGSIGKAWYKEYLENNRDINVFYTDNYSDNVKGYEIYKEIVKEEKKYPNITFLYWLEKSILSTVKANIIQYLSAKVGTPEHLRYFKVIAGDMYDALEADTTTIKIPKHIEYCLTDRFAKELVQKM